MVKILLECTVIFFAVVGFIEIIRIGSLLLITPKVQRYCALVIPIHGHDEDIEILLRSLIDTVMWESSSKIQQLVCLNCNMDEETLEICERVCNDFSFVHICTPEEYCSNIRHT